MGSSRQDIRATASSFGTVRLVESKALVIDQESTAISSRPSSRVTGMIEATFSAPLIGKLIWGDFDTGATKKW